MLLVVAEWLHGENGAAATAATMATAPKTAAPIDTERMTESFTGPSSPVGHQPFGNAPGEIADAPFPMPVTPTPTAGRPAPVDTMIPPSAPFSIVASVFGLLASLRNLLYIPAMVDVSDLEGVRQRSAAVARALADPKRLCVLQSLADGELSVRELSDQAGCHVPNMSQHLAVLRNSGLVLTRRDGNAIYYRLADPRILEACRLLQSIAG